MKQENGQQPPENLGKVREKLIENYPLIQIPAQSYLILMSPRSGSTLLCAHLEEIGFGRPTEGFHFSKQALIRRFGQEQDFNDPYVHTVTALNHGTVNGVFGLKLSWVEFKVFLKKARILIGENESELTDMDVMDIFFPDAKIVRLIRRNKVKQAVSYAKAMQTGVWNEQVNASDAYKAYIVPPEYSRNHIEALFDNLLAYDLSWKHFLDRHQRECLDVWYEDLASDYMNVMTRVCEYLGVKNNQALEPPLKRQSNQVNQRWTQRFQEETPWLQAPIIKEGLADGDFDAVFFHRSRTMFARHERQVWASIPYHKHKKIKQLLYRIQLRLGLKNQRDI